VNAFCPAFLSSSIGAVVAVAGAIAASPLTPIGSLASYEPEPGLEINIALLGAGGAAIAAAVAAVFALITFRAIRVLEDDRRRTHSRIVERVSALGGSAPLVVGLRFAFERGRGRTAVPIRSALAGATLGVAGLIAVASFAASLDRLVATPERYGWQGDLQIVDLKPERRVAMLADRRVASFAEISMASAGSPSGSVISISGFESVRGSLAWTMLEGRMPATRDEIAVGPRLAKRLGLSVGSVLVLASPDAGEHLPKSVIGIGLGSTSSDSFGDDAVMTPEGFAGAARTQGFVNGYIGLADGVDSDAFARELGESAEIEQPEPPPEVQNLSGLGRLPALLAGILTLIAVAAIVNALVVGVRRRRRDIAILHALGFVRSQVARAVRTSAVAMTVTSLVVGLPIGLAVGRTAWRAVAETAYVAGDAAWARNVLILIGPAALVLGLAASVVPAMRASRLRPSVTLRTE
jgi:putative ABC transport system permease protein